MSMARAATTSDVFNAVAEPKRRDIIRLLTSHERTVGDLSLALSTAQSAVSKHLHVLSEVGVVTARAVGRHRLYRLNARKLKPVHDWVKAYERFWNEQFDKLDAYLSSRKRTTPPDV